MSGFDILTLVGEPWNDSTGVFGGISVDVNDVASFPSSKFLELILNGASVYRILKTGESIISNPSGSSLGGMRLAGDGGQMALTSQMDMLTGQPAQALSYFWENPSEVGYNPRSEAVLQGMGSTRFSIKSQATFTHVAGNSRYEWQGGLGPRIQWSGQEAATNTGMTIDFTNVGQWPRRASPVVSVSGANAADDLVHFGLSDGKNWAPKARIGASGQAQFQALDLPEQATPGDPGAATARLYALSVGGVTRLAFRDSTGAETVLTGYAGNVVSGSRTAAAGTVDGESGAHLTPDGQPAPADLTVGGVTGQVQYNDAGALAGLTGITVTAGAASAIALTGGTAIVSSPLVSLSQTWNASVKVFHAIDVNITDTASDYSSTFFRARVNGVDKFQVTRDEAIVLGPYDGQPAGIRRLTGSVLGMCSLLSNTNGRIAPVIGYYWQNQLPNGRAKEDIAVMRGFGQEMLKIESLGSVAFVSETGAYNMEVGWNAPTSRMWWSATEKESTEGRTIDFNNMGQSPRPQAIASFTSEVDTGDLLHFSKWTGADWTVRGKVDAMGRAGFASLDLPLQSDPGDPAAGSGRLYAKDVGGATKLAFRDEAGAESVFGTTTPGGLNGQIQYNDNGTFGGAAGVGIVAGVVSQIAAVGGTVTSSSPLFSGTQTWNNAATTFAAFEANITNTASQYDSAFFRASADGVHRFRVTRDDTLVFGPDNNNPIGIRRFTGGTISICSLLSNTSGKIAPVVSFYWDSPPLPNGRANEAVAVLRGHGTNRLSIESDSAIVHISDTGRYEWEAGFTNNSGRIQWIGYQKSSAEGRTFDFNNYGQTPTRADPIVSFSSDVDTGDLVHFSKSTGNGWEARGKVDARGRAMFQSLDLPEQATVEDPLTDTGRLYTKDVGGLTRLAFRTAAGIETLLGASTATVETIVPDSTIILYDAAGNAYKVPCVAV